MQAITGERRMDASALLEYFAPLRAWLDERNANRTCGW
jgi:peptidyl-dipeptidase A